MAEPSPNNLQVQHDAGVCTISFDRPAKKNALTRAMYAGLVAALEQAQREPATRVVVVQGSQGVFTAGNDLLDFMNAPPVGPQALARDEAGLPTHPLLRLLFLLPRFSKPLIAAVQGPAIGIGVTMLLHCDLVYVGQSARLQLPFVNLGLCPEAASSLLLPKIMGHVRASELLMLGEPFTAETALRYGLVNEVLPDDAVLERAHEVARKLVRKPAASLRATKQLLRAPYAEQTQDVLAKEIEQFGQRLTSPEAREAFEAFFGKREPDFTRFD